MKMGLVLFGGGVVGVYQAGMTKVLAECGTQTSMVLGASTGAPNGVIIAASPDLSEVVVRLEVPWDHLENNQVPSVNRLTYFSLLKKLFQAMNFRQIPGRAGALLTTLLRYVSILDGFDNPMAQPLLSDEPLTALLDHCLDIDALADGLPSYVSLYPTEGGMQDIIDCACTELGVGTTKDVAFQHIQSLPHGWQREALLVSTTLPLLFRSREVQGTMFGDGGTGGWRNMQGNTPVTPLVDVGCNMVIVTYLSDGSLWDRQALPDTTILEIRPRKGLKYAGDGDNSDGLLSFTLAHTDVWRQQGCEGTTLTTEHIWRPLTARQVLSWSETVLQKSLEITEETDLVLRNAIARIKQRRSKETPPPMVVFFLAGVIKNIFRYILPERKLYPSSVNSFTGNLIMQLPVKSSMSFISLVSVTAHVGKCKDYTRDKIKYWRYTSYRGGESPEGFTDEKFSSAIYNGGIFTTKRLHTLILFLVVLFTGLNVEVASVKQALSRSLNVWVEQPGARPTTCELHEGDAAYKTTLDRALKPVGLSGMFGRGGCMDGPGGNVTLITINGTAWLQGDGYKANTCGWGFIVTSYNPKTHEVVGYRYFGLDDPVYLAWFGEIGVHEPAYLVKNYVAAAS